MSIVTLDKAKTDWLIIDTDEDCFRTAKDQAELDVVLAEWYDATGDLESVLIVAPDGTRYTATATMVFNKVAVK